MASRTGPGELGDPYGPGAALSLHDQFNAAVRDADIWVVLGERAKTFYKDIATAMAPIFEQNGHRPAFFYLDDWEDFVEFMGLLDSLPVGEGPEALIVRNPWTPRSVRAQLRQVRERLEGRGVKVIPIDTPFTENDSYIGIANWAIALDLVRMELREAPFAYAWLWMGRGFSYTVLERVAGFQSQIEVVDPLRLVSDLRIDDVMFSTSVSDSKHDEDDLRTAFDVFLRHGGLRQETVIIFAVNEHVARIGYDGLNSRIGGGFPPQWRIVAFDELPWAPERLLVTEVLQPVEEIAEKAALLAIGLGDPHVLANRLQAVIRRKTRARA